jgi:O-antigen/teichoic acid export membrane protein
MHAGLLFFVIQLAGTVAFSSDALILAHVLGPAAVAQYSVASKLFDGVYMVSALFLTPLWPAYAEAYARGDLSWVRRTLKMSLTITAAVSFAISIVLVSAGRFVTHVWVGDQVEYSAILFLLCGLWAVLRTTGNSLAMFMNGIGWIGFQAILSIPFAALAVVAKVTITRRIGIFGIPVALIAAYILALALPYSIRIPQFLSKPSQ